MNEVQKAQSEGLIVVFSSEGCGQCIATHRALDSKGIAYRSVVVADDDDETRSTLRELGFMQLPVVWAPRVGHWAGFRPDKIAEIHQDIAQSYRDGMFWTRCRCGDEFPGVDPVDADAGAYEHCFPEEATR